MGTCPNPIRDLDRQTPLQVSSGIICQDCSLFEKVLNLRQAREGEVDPGPRERAEHREGCTQARELRAQQPLHFTDGS
jgi:hypothetical protein